MVYLPVRMKNKAGAHQSTIYTIYTTVYITHARRKNREEQENYKKNEFFLNLIKKKKKFKPVMKTDPSFLFIEFFLDLS